MTWRMFRPPARTSSPSHLYAIDFARGLAAVAVLFWHYQHFWYTTAGIPTLPLGIREQQPLFPLIAPFYKQGGRAVELFWTISGFVFTAVYVAGDPDRRVGTREFVVNRFARLWPLHLVTLVIVALLQLANLRIVGHWQIIGENDLFHFILNLFMVTRWGPWGDGFNAVIWSVSVELLVYVLFWAVRPFLFRWGVVGPLLLALAGQLVSCAVGPFRDNGISLCVFYFFVGSAIFLAVRGGRWHPLAIGGAAAAAIVGGLKLTHAFPETLGWPLVVFGVLLAFCAVEEAGHGHRFRVVRWIGDCTYGTYLWHLPIQIAALLILDGWVGSRAIVRSPWFLVGFIVSTLAVARLSFILIEAPARRRIRAWADRSAEPSAPAAAGAPPPPSVR